MRTTLKVRVSLSFLLTLMLALLVGCGDRPPMPALKAGKQNVHVELGTYSWRFLAKHVIADSAGPSYMIDLDKEAAILSPQTELTISFSSKPKKMFLTQWEGQNELSSVELKSKTFRLPAEKGTYLYSIRAEWGRGSGNYAFAVKIQ